MLQEESRHCHRSSSDVDPVPFHEITFRDGRSRAIDPEQHTVIDKDPTLVIALRQNRFYQRVLPALLEQCADSLSAAGIRVVPVVFPRTATPEEIFSAMWRDTKNLSGTLALMDATVRRSWGLTESLRSNLQIKFGSTLDELFARQTQVILARLWFGTESMAQRAAYAPDSERWMPEAFTYYGNFVAKVLSLGIKRQEPAQIGIYQKGLMDHIPFSRYYLGVLMHFFRESAPSDAGVSAVQAARAERLGFALSALAQRLLKSPDIGDDERIAAILTRCLDPRLPTEKKAGAVMRIMLNAAEIPPAFKAMLESVLQESIPQPIDVLAGWVRDSGYPQERIVLLRSDDERKVFLDKQRSASHRKPVWLLVDRHYSEDGVQPKEGSAAPFVIRLSLPIQDLIHDVAEHHLIESAELPGMMGIAKRVARDIVGEALNWKDTHLFKCDVPEIVGWPWRQ